MLVKLKKGMPKGEFIAPPSKSYSHRYLIASALAKESEVSHLQLSKDILATLFCIQALGIEFENKKTAIHFTDNEYVSVNPIFYCMESGSTLRFFIPLALTKYQDCVFVGTQRLMERGVDIYQDIFPSVQFKKEGEKLFLHGRIQSGKYEMVGNVSSQYITGLLFALPLLDGDSDIVLTTPLESKNYIDITLDVLSQFGIRIEATENGYHIPGKQKYRPKDSVVEGDYSNAAFLDAFSYLGAPTTVLGLKEDSLQGDKVYKEYFKQLSESNAKLDISDCIDLGPVLFSFASLFHGGTFTGTRRLKIKESDRGEAMKQELEKVGCEMVIHEDDIEVYPAKNIHPVSFDSHNDHRIAMALSLYVTKTDIEISNAQAVSKSYPDYFETLQKHGLEVEHENR